MLSTESQSSATAWLLDLTAPVAADDFAALTAVLDDGERRRAERVLKAWDREPFIAAHTLLRAALSTFVARPPSAWAFVQVGHHKPTIYGEDFAGLRFSLTHCPGFAACAVARGGEVGIDVEPLRPVLDVDAYRRVLSTEERHALNAVRPPDADRLFWRIWTAKEAIGKATGHGIAERLTAFTVTPTTSGFALTGDVPLPNGTVRALECGPGHVGAIATESDIEIDVRHVTVGDVFALLRRSS